MKGKGQMFVMGKSGSELRLSLNNTDTNSGWAQPVAGFAPGNLFHQLVQHGGARETCADNDKMHVPLPFTNT